MYLRAAQFKLYGKKIYCVYLDMCFVVVKEISFKSKFSCFPAGVPFRTRTCLLKYYSVFSILQSKTGVCWLKNEDIVAIVSLLLPFIDKYISRS